MISAAETSGSSTTIVGSLSGADTRAIASSSSAPPRPTPPDDGQGQTFLMAASVTTDSAGEASFTVQTRARYPPGGMSARRRPARAATRPSSRSRCSSSPMSPPRGQRSSTSARRPPTGPWGACGTRSTRRIPMARPARRSSWRWGPTAHRCAAGPARDPECHGPAGQDAHDRRQEPVDHDHHRGESFNSRIMEIIGPETVILENLTISGGTAHNGGILGGARPWGAAC